MATFEITEGAPGQGKSLYTARTARKILLRNIRWEHAGNPRRKIYSNMKFSNDFEKEFDGYIEYWSDSSTLVKLHDCDIIWDEIATELDARNWPNLSIEMKRFLSQYRKRGIDIYGNAQDFLTIDPSVRRLTSELFSVYKVMGSRRPGENRPPVRWVWGLLLSRHVDPKSLATINDENNLEYKGLPHVELIQKKVCAVFDTTQDFGQLKYPPLHHKEQKCDTCLKTIVKHI